MGIEPTELASPRLRKLAEEVASQSAEAMESFWAEIAQIGTPLIEQADDEGSMLVTLLAHGTDDPPRPYVSAFGLGGVAPFDREMQLLDGTDVLYWTRPVPRDVRTIYAFAPGLMAQDLIDDPLARQPHVFPADPEFPDDKEQRAAKLELPDAPPLRWSTPTDDAPRGRVQEDRFRSEILDDDRRVYTYLPTTYEPDAGPYPLLIVFDGWAFTQLVQAQITLDNLIHHGGIPPLVAVMPDSGDNAARMRELGMSDDHNAYVTDELLPWARERWNLSTSPSQVIAAGSSLGGVAATYLAMKRPDVTASVLSLSGAFQFAPEDGTKPTMWIAHELARRDPLPIRFWLNAGELETISDRAWPSIRAANRHLHDVLVAKGYRVDYSEFPGGHDYLWWVETIADGLIALLG